MRRCAGVSSPLPRPATTPARSPQSPGRTFDGITVSEIFTADESARAVEQQMLPGIFGEMLGLSLADLARVTDDLDDRTPYFERAEATNGLLHDAFGFDPFIPLTEALTPMAGGLALKTPSEQGRQYPAAKVRWMVPSGRGLPAHVGNEFALQEDGPGAHLRRVTKIRDHYSWFVWSSPHPGWRPVGLRPALR